MNSCQQHQGGKGMKPRVHTFSTTGEAYIASRTRDEIHDGDVLVATDEGVVGITRGAWPTAITVATGAFHDLAPKYSWDAIPDVEGEGTTDYSASLTLAEAEADKLATGKAPQPDEHVEALGGEAHRAAA
jgi:hypothetical protein